MRRRPPVAAAFCQDHRTLGCGRRSSPRPWSSSRTTTPGPRSTRTGACTGRRGRGGSCGGPRR
eukprot:12747828-Prorocentrum_lima.AAC.1